MSKQQGLVRIQSIRSLYALVLVAGVTAACGDSSPTAPSVSVASVAVPPVGAPLATTPAAGTGGALRPASLTGATTPNFVAGGAGTNYTCRDLAGLYAPGAEWLEIKLDQMPTGSHLVRDTALSVSVTNGTNTTFDWTSTIPVDAVFVKSGQEGHNLYVYQDESTGGVGLSTPAYTKKNGDIGYQDISHITFCYDVELLVSKTVSTTFTRDFDWSISKTVDQPSVSIQDAGQAAVTYTVGVTKDTGTDSDWAVAGAITVTNPHPTLTATGITVNDMLSGYGAIAVSCPATSLAGLASMECSYGPVALSDGTARTNTGSADSATYGIVKGSGEAAVAFVTPTTVLDDAVTLTDTFSGAGIAGSLASSRTFTYGRTIAGTDIACGATATITNTASIATDDGATRTASANVTATRTCTPVEPPVTVCTRTQGYWGTHSTFGPAKYDATWAQIGENTPFFLSGQSYYQVIQVPTKGNAYYQLAHQYIAAKLNMLKGAAAPAGVAFGPIEAFFQTYTPAQVAAMKGNNATRQQALAWATLLDQYNNGLLNVPHCG